jgi:beta-1,4-mannosyl-glycoprotein beta-1,4-N-acetylglucosaminyltransferase
MNNNFRVFDCFTYDGESCLDLRLRVHWERVDWFVIVESNITFTGQPKDYAFDSAKYAWAKSKIRYIQLDALEFGQCSNAWERETFQRDALKRGYADAQPHDTVIIADVDEILRPECIRRVEGGTYHRFEQLMMYFYCDYLCVSEPLWTRMKAVTGRFALDHTPQEIRTGKQLLNSLKEVNVPLAGWHFSYLGGVDEINRKLERFSHQEFNKGKYKDPTRNMQRILDGKDIYGRPKLWGKASGCDLECQPVKNWFQSQPHLFSPSESHYRGTVQEAVEVFRRRSWLSRKIQRNILRIWNKF